jgi:uncharacterized protein YdhG (YjbR/CyaY superfamily)
MDAAARFNTVDEYIGSFTGKTKTLLEKMRKTVTKAAPKAEELISYNMPSLNLHGRLIYYAGYKNHIGFYPMASGISAFKKEISVYKNAKGSVQFPLDKPLPADLISNMVKFRVKENLEKASIKLKKKKP